MSETEGFRRITAEAFAALDFSKVTLVDLREPDEVLVSGIEGALNIPLNQFATKLDDVPKDKPVVVFCRVGDWSEEIAEILAERGYDVTNLDGGYQAYRDYLKKDAGSAGEPKIQKAQKAAEPVFIDAKGLKCPGPIVKVADYLRGEPDGTKIRVEATEDAFYSDIQVWCERTGNTLDAIDFTDGVIRAAITKSAPKTANAPAKEQNGKTFVVFSGDLDKTIAAFIMANGAAAMGRQVTMFFTFWGLNILRRPEKVSVTKTFIEKMFGIMMPRGTTKLGLSRMNMGGAGAKMIRGIMKQKGISSLEELIDGVELGGVSTFLGSGEESDMSLFI